MAGKVSRQRLWAKRMAASGRCRVCSQPVWREGSGLCLKHHERDKQRKRKTYADKKGG